MYWNVFCYIGIVLVVAFVVLTILALISKPFSVYADERDQRNPFEGKRVVFFEDPNDEVNADGVRGHLVEAGDASFKESFYCRGIKRIIDIFLSFCGLVLLFPLCLLIVAAIKIENPGPAFFTQKRVGQNKRFFKLHKFRSMKMSTPRDVPTHMLEDPAQHITKVGRILRGYSLDELPQLWDIFIGNMSIVGPRPGLWNQDLLTAEREKYYANDVKPGLTGWAQINGRDELDIPMKVKLDGVYVTKMSFLFDCRCFFKTIKKVFQREGVVESPMADYIE